MKRVAFTFDDELKGALDEVPVPILGEVAGLEVQGAGSLEWLRRRFDIAQGAFEKARAKEFRSGIAVPKAVEDEYMNAYEAFEREAAKAHWDKAGDDGSIQPSRNNLFYKRMIHFV